MTGLTKPNQKHLMLFSGRAYPELADALDICDRLRLHVRDAGALASAIERPAQVVWGEEAYVGIHAKAAALLDAINRSHPLVDGNKRLSVLLVLWFNGPPHRLSPTKLSRRIAQSPSGMTHTVKRLTAAGLVSRVGLETDGRAKHVELTDEGLEVVRRAGKDLAAAIEAVFPREHLPVEHLAESQRLITEVLTRAVSPGPT